MKIGDWVVTPALNQLERDGRALKIEPRSMELLVCLARHARDVVSTDQLIAEVWNGRVIEESGVYKQINLLRTALGDEAQRPKFIETIPKRGYRLIAPVECDAAARRASSPAESEPLSAKRTAPPWLLLQSPYWLAVGLLVVAAIAVAVWELNPRSLTGPESPAAGPPPNSVAVLPFDNLSPDPKDSYFALGMNDQIVTELTELGGLRVASRQSALRYSGSQKSVGEIAHELGVAAVLDGTVSYADGSVRVTAHLTDGATNEIRWSGSYQHELSNIFAIQSDIALEVARALKGRLSSTARERVARVPTTSMPAYLLYLQADARRWRDSREEQLTAIDEVEQALELSNDFIAAWILDSDLRMSAQFYDSDHRADHQATGERAARRAIELDPELGAAHAALAEVLVSKGDWLGAEAEFREARRLNPALDAADMHSYCVLLLAVAYFAPAREHLEQQRRLEPEHSAVLRMLVLADAYLGEWQLAKTQYESGARLFKPWREYEMMHLMVGHDELAGAREIPAAGPINPAMLANLDDRQTALHELRRLSTDPVDSALPTNRRDIAIWAAHFGDSDLALNMMRSAMRDQAAQGVYLWLPQLKGVRQLPAFKTLMREIGFVAYWEKYGWPPICRKLRGDDFECD